MYAGRSDVFILKSRHSCNFDNRGLNGLFFIVVLEFIYAQSPDNMKGLLIGLHYFLIGVWASVTFLLLKKIHKDNDHDLLEFTYYMCYSVVGFVGFFLFALVSCFYTNRRRNNPITDIMRISSYY